MKNIGARGFILLGSLTWVTPCVGLRGSPGDAEVKQWRICVSADIKVRSMHHWDKNWQAAEIEVEAIGEVYEVHRLKSLNSN